MLECTMMEQPQCRIKHSQQRRDGDPGGRPVPESCHHGCEKQSRALFGEEATWDLSCPETEQNVNWATSRLL